MAPPTCCATSGTVGIRVGNTTTFALENQDMIPPGHTHDRAAVREDIKVARIDASKSIPPSFWVMFIRTFTPAIRIRTLHRIIFNAVFSLAAPASISTRESVKQIFLFFAFWALCCTEFITAKHNIDYNGTDQIRNKFLLPLRGWPDSHQNQGKTQTYHIRHSFFVNPRTIAPIRNNKAITCNLIHILLFLLSFYFTSPVSKYRVISVHYLQLHSVFSLCICYIYHTGCVLKSKMV